MARFGAVAGCAWWRRFSLVQLSLSLDRVAAQGYSQKCMQFLSRERSLTLLSLPGGSPVSGILGLCIATCDNTGAVRVHLISLSLWAELCVVGYLIWVDFGSHSTEPLGSVCLYSGVCIFGAFWHFSPWVWDLCVGVCTWDCESSEILILGPKLWCLWAALRMGLSKGVHYQLLGDLCTGCRVSICLGTLSKGYMMFLSY